MLNITSKLKTKFFVQLSQIFDQNHKSKKKRLDIVAAKIMK